MRKILFIIITALLLITFEKVQIYGVFAKSEDITATAEISSPTNPNQNDWYSNQSAIFSWKNSTEIIGASVEFNNNPTTTPDFISEGVFYSKSYEYIGSGIWYFHLRTQNKSGWSSVSHFKIQIDRKVPDNFNIKVDNEGDPTSPKPLLYFEAEDDLSGISHYRIKIDNKETSLVVPGEINPFVMPLQSFGSHKITILAVDKAGNKKEASADVNIKSIPSPEISVHPGIYNAGDEILYIGGKALPNSIIVISFRQDNNLIKIWETTSDEEGSWSFYSDELFPNGIYAISATTEDSRGAVSDLSKEYEVEVSLNGITIGSLLIDYGSLILILALLVIIFLSVTVCVCCKMRKEREKIWKETKEAELSLKKTFKELRNDLEKKIEYFDSKPGLSVGERKIRDSVFKILRDSEKIVEKEIRDIKREIK
ncbi:hypothetical protein KAT63_03945 [Candidatus Parcubacteria bacterium]|nr:hypothetical protein [Candidatus Parcubacteria bacterium]